MVFGFNFLSIHLYIKHEKINNNDIFSCAFLITNAQIGDPPVIAPFQKIDTYCINDWWNHAKAVRNDPKKIIDVDVPLDQVVCFGI